MKPKKGKRIVLGEGYAYYCVGTTGFERASIGLDKHDAGALPENANEITLKNVYGKKIRLIAEVLDEK